MCCDADRQSRRSTHSTGRVILPPRSAAQEHLARLAARMICHSLESKIVKALMLLRVSGRVAHGAPLSCHQVVDLTNASSSSFTSSEAFVAPRQGAEHLTVRTIQVGLAAVAGARLRMRSLLFPVFARSQGNDEPTHDAAARAGIHQCSHTLICRQEKGQASRARRGLQARQARGSSLLPVPNNQHTPQPPDPTQHSTAPRMRLTAAATAPPGGGPRSSSSGKAAEGRGAVTRSAR